jgi:hypothetical protein
MSDRAKPRPTSPQGDSDTLRISRREGTRYATGLYLALALLLIACSAGYILTTCHHSPPPAADSSPSSPPMDTLIAEQSRDLAKPGNAAARSTPRKVTTAPGGAITPRRTEPTPAPPQNATEEQGTGDEDATLDLSMFVPRGEAPSIGEVIDQLHNAGIYSGIGAFSPPGTRPPLVGLAVPDDFELPEGYVRHFQATDDGQRIEPILMFSPDYAFFDDKGQPIEIPPDRVVPAELAPVGLPIREIEIPPHQELGDLSR